MMKIMSMMMMTLMMSVGFQPRQATAAECENLPPSRLRLYNVDIPKSDEITAPAVELKRDIPPNSLVSSHTMMLTVRDFVGWFRIENRLIPQSDGTVCNTPDAVDIGFGSSLRKTVIADVVADDACVRRQMADHEATHSSAFGTAVDQFIKDNEDAFRQGMIALKRTPASTVESASAQWSKGLQLMINQSKQTLMATLREVNTAVDTPSALAALEAACGEKIRKLQETLLPQAAH